ncbi:phospholipase D family protein [Nocardioides koreensis]
MNGDLDRQLLARSVHRLWERRVKAAAESVRVFAPYLDRTLTTLLKKAGPDVELAVVTDLSPASGVLNYAWQLRGVQRLLKEGVEVRSLRRLHAKVLLVDGSHATIGSQNFTAYGRGSKEATVAPEVDLQDSRFIATLAAWFEESEPVDLAFIERLLERLAPQITKAQDAQQELIDAYEEAEEKEAELRRRDAAARRIERDRELIESNSLGIGLREAAASTAYRAGQTTAYARLTWDATYSYKTLMATDKDTDLSTWWLRFGDIIFDTIRLQGYDFYPALLGPDGRMAFVRVTKSRITYVWRSLRRGSAQTVAGWRVWLVPGFPDHGLEEANMTVTAKWSRETESGYQMRLRFDGEKVLRADGWGFVGNSSDRLLEQAVTAAYEDEDQWRELLRGVFASVAQPVRFRNTPNAESFFSAGWHRIDLTTFLDQPVLLIQPS